MDLNHSPSDTLTPIVDDTVPVGLDHEGEPVYARTELDERLEALLARYDHHGLPHDRQLVADAFTTICAIENLPLADEAVEVLAELTDRAKRRVAQTVLGNPDTPDPSPQQVLTAVLGKMDHARIKRHQSQAAEDHVAP